MIQIFDLELLRLTFVIGIVVSVTLYERTHRTTGSLVVPGYLAAQLLNPLALVATALNALLTFALASRVIPRFAAIYGRARFTLNIAISVLLNLLLGPVLNSIVGASVPILDTIGYVVPALIAYDMNRQGPRQTARSVTVAAIITAVPALLIVLIRPDVVETLPPNDTGLLPVGEVWFPVVALISTAVASTLQTNHRLRSGGFVGAMYLGLAATQPTQLVFFGVAALTTYLVIHLGLKRWMITFGRRKFASMLMLGSMLSWALLEVIDYASPGALGIAGLPLAAIFVPALLANDMERTSPTSVLIGAYLAGAATLSLTLVLSSVVDEVDRPVWAAPLALVSVGIIAWPALARRLNRAATATVVSSAPVHLGR